ncbi:O-antigen ligase family protein [Gordonia sp. zg691]|nr:O-antigen ligase family protein [Gordonia jinghuaiqii]
MGVVTVIVATLFVALVLFVLAARDKDWVQRVDPFLCAWLSSITAWPVIVIYAAAPAIWASADAAGPIFAVLLYGPAAGLSVAAALRAIATHGWRIDHSAAILGLLMVYACAAMVIDGSGRIINIGMSMAMLVGFIFRYRSFGLDDVARAARIALVVTSASLLISVAFNSSRVVGACRIDKCTDLGAVLTSPFAGNGNLAGITITALLPFAVYRIAMWRVLAAVGGVALIGMLAGSRTAFGGIAVAGFLGVLLAIPSVTPRLRNLLLGLAVVASAVYSLFPLYIGYTNADYSLRGYLWNQALREIPDQWFFGHNPAYWVESGASLLFKANYSPHNGWLEILLSVGVWGVGLIILAAVVKVVEIPDGTTRAYLLAYFSTILALSSLEAVYVPYFLGIAPFAALLPYFLYHHPPAQPLSPVVRHEVLTDTQMESR